MYSRLKLDHRSWCSRGGSLFLGFKSLWVSKGARTEYSGLEVVAVVEAILLTRTERCCALTLEHAHVVSILDRERLL